MEMKKMCVCFEIKTGVMIVGAWTLISFVMAVMEHAAIKIALLMFTSGWFVAML